MIAMLKRQITFDEPVTLTFTEDEGVVTVDFHTDRETITISIYDLRELVLNSGEDVPVEDPTV
jgi:hypothetical protein